MSQGYPAGFPKPTIPVQRFLTSLWMEEKEGKQERLVKVLDTLYEALWTEPNDADVVDPKGFSRVLAPVIEEDVIKKHVEKMTSPEVKKQLIQNTDRSFQDGAFGLPWFHCQNPSGEVEGFWGFDHLGQVVRFMELDGKGEVRALL